MAQTRSRSGAAIGLDTLGQRHIKRKSSFSLVPHQVTNPFVNIMQITQNCDDEAPVPEKPPQQFQVAIREDFVEIVVREVTEHALQAHNKDRITELSMLDALASFEEIMIKRYPTMSKEVSARIYKHLITTLNNKTLGRPSTNLHSSLMSTMNQDLQFDFQGSFGEALKLKNNISRQTGGNRNSIHSSLQSEDYRPQKQPKLFPHLNLFGTTLSSQGVVQTPSLQQSDDRIKLPKLSFNDLIQVQKHDTFKKLAQNDAILIDDAPQQVDDEEISDMSVFKQSNRQTSRLYGEQLASSRSMKNLDVSWKFPKLQLLRDSELLSMDSQMFSNKFQRSQEDSIESTQYVPIRDTKSQGKTSQGKLTQKGHTQRAYSSNRVQKKSKENAIDSDIKLALAFWAKKLLLKSWRSFLINRMHTIHNTHANKLSRAYYTRKLQYKYLQLLKLYVKRILPAERQMELADRFHRATTLRQHFSMFRYQIYMQKSLNDRLIQSVRQLRKNQTKRAFAQLKMCIARTQISTLRRKQSDEQSVIRLKHKTLKAFALYSVASKRRKEFAKIQKIFLEQQLTRRAFKCLSFNISHKRQKVRKLLKAKSHFKNHYQILIVSKALYVLQQYAKHARQQKQAITHRNQWLSFRHFKMLKFNCLVRRGARNQRQFVDSFRDSKLKARVIHAITEAQQQTRDHVDLVQNFIERGKKRKVLRVLQRYRHERFIRFPPSSGAFLTSCLVLLRNSFGELMENVWKEFPKQKISVNHSSGHEHHLLNYLGLSRNPRYRQFYYIANLLLRKHIMAKYLKALKNNAQRIRVFKQRQCDNIMRLCFQFMDKQCRKQVIVRTIIRRKQYQREKYAKKVVLDGLLKHQALQRAFVTVRNQTKQITLNQSFGLWLKKTDRLKQVKVDDRASIQIYRQRFLTKYLSLWLHKLHISLKKKHLHQQQATFMKKSGLKKRYFAMWSQLYIKHQYLDEQEQQISIHQSNSLFSTCFQALKQYSSDRRLISTKMMGADQEYTFWLAKRALANLRQGIQAVKFKTALISQIQKDYEHKVESTILYSLKLYAKYRRDRRINDYMMEKSVHSLEKKRYLMVWRRQLSKHVATKFIAHTLAQVSQRNAFSKIKDVIDSQDQSILEMYNRRAYYNVLQHFRALKNSKSRAKFHAEVSERIKKSTRTQILSHSFADWRNQFRSTRKLYVTYAFIVIQLKNQFLTPIFKSWRSQLNQSKCLRNARQLSVNRTKMKVFAFLKLRSLNRHKSNAIYDYITQNRKSKSILQFYNEWRQLFFSCQQLKERLSLSQIKTLKTVFKALSVHRNLKQYERMVFDQKVCAINLVRRNYEMKRLVGLCKARIQKKDQLKKASLYHREYMYRSAYKAWATFYKCNATYIKLSLHHRRQRERNMKEKFIEKWLARSSSTLRRMKAVKNMLNIKNLKSVKAKFMTWVDQVNFLISLDQRVSLLSSRLEMKDKHSMIKKFRVFTHKRKINRQRNIDVDFYAHRKLQFKTLIHLIRYKERRREIRRMKQIALLQYFHSLEKYTFLLLREIAIQQQCIQKAQLIMRKTQIHLYGKGTLKKLRVNRNKRKQYRVLTSFAYEFLKQSLLNRSIKVLFTHAKYSYAKRQMTEVAYATYQKCLSVRVIQSLILYAEYHSTQVMKRDALKQAIMRVDHMQNMSITFKALSSYVVSMKDEAKQCEKKLKRRVCLKVLQALSTNHHEKSSLREAYNKVSKRACRKAEIQSYTEWRKVYLNQRMISDHIMVREVRSKMKVFAELKRRTHLLSMLSKIRRKGIGKLLTNTFGGFLQYLQHRRDRQLLKGTSELTYLHHLCRQVFKAFQKVKLRRQTLQIGITIRNYRLMQKSVKSFKNRVSLGHQLIQFSSSCKSKILQRCVSTWLNQYHLKQIRKEKLCSLLSQQHCQNQLNSFKQWKKEVYFSRMCELIYTHRYQEEEQWKFKQCFFEWLRYFRHSKNKQYQKESIEINHQKRVMHEVMQVWKKSSRDTLFAIKMNSLVANKLHQGLQSLIDYSSFESRLSHIGEKIQRKQERQTKSDFMTIWKLARIETSKNRIVQQTRKNNVMRTGLKSLAMNRLKNLESKYQMLRIIQLFSERRPQMLLAFSKAFLLMSKQHCQTIDVNDRSVSTRVCSTTLAKYALEKWKSARAQLAVSNASNMQSQRFLIYNLLRKGFHGLREGIDVVCQKRSLKLSCYEFYHVSMMKKVIHSLLYNQQKNIERRNLENRCLQFQAMSKERNIYECFMKWHIKQQQIQRLKNFEWVMKARYNSDTLLKVFQALKNYTIRQQSANLQYENAVYQVQLNLMMRYFTKMRSAYAVLQKSKVVTSEQLALADEYRAHQLQKRVFTQLRASAKDLKLRSKYSKVYTVFVAWKFFVKEKRLLNKYLTECNYQQSTKSGKRNIRSPRLSTHVASTRALVDLDIQTHSLRAGSAFAKQEQKPLNFTPTLGQAINFQHMQESNYMDENFNSINSPISSLSPQPRSREQSSQANPRYAQLRS